MSDFFKLCCVTFSLVITVFLGLQDRMALADEVDARCLASYSKYISAPRLIQYDHFFCRQKDFIEAIQSPNFPKCVAAIKSALPTTSISYQERTLETCTKKNILKASEHYSFARCIRTVASISSLDLDSMQEQVGICVHENTLRAIQSPALRECVLKYTHTNLGRMYTKDAFATCSESEIFKLAKSIPICPEVREKSLNYSESVKDDCNDALRFADEYCENPYSDQTKCLRRLNDRLEKLGCEGSASTIPNFKCSATDRLWRCQLKSSNCFFPYIAINEDGEKTVICPDGYRPSPNNLLCKLDLTKKVRSTKDVDPTATEAK